MSAVATACPICLGAGQASKAQELAGAQQVVLAQPTADAGRFRVVDVIKGERPAERTIDGGLPRSASPADSATPPGRTLLMVRTDPFPVWTILGATSREKTDWLRRLVKEQRASDLSVQAWQPRLELVLPSLETPDPLIAELAYGEFAAAPYAAMRTTKPRLDARAVRGWLADSKLAGRQRLYWLLIGIAGGPNDAAMLDQRLEAAWKSGDPANLAAMLTADLELRGASRLAWVEAKYLRDRARTAAEIEAALLALSVHGGAPGVIPREQVIQSYRVFMKARPEIAGFVARDFAAWQYWDAVPDYMALMKSDVRQQFPSKLAILAYLQQSPSREAREFGRQTRPLPASP